jgi:hypothetical protein
MKLLKLLSVVTLVTLSGCARQYSVVPAETAKVAEKPTAPPDPSLVEGATWSMNLELPHTWKRLQATSTAPVLTEFQAVSKEKVAGMDVQLEVLMGPHSMDDDIDFIKSVLEQQTEEGQLKVVSVKRAKLESGEVAAAVLGIQMTEEGPVAIFQVITSKDHKGYVALCAGALAGVKTFGPVCAATLQTFKLKVTKPSVKPTSGPKVPVSTPESTQT